MSVNQIVIAVSSCLLGHKVRYDGSDKQNLTIKNQLCNYFNCRAICPEYAVGLGVPRDPIQVVKTNGEYRAIGVTDKSIDVTHKLARYAEFVNKAEGPICGYVFKAQSPSCGLYDVPVFDVNGYQIKLGSGIFAQRMRQINISLPVIDEARLLAPEGLWTFIQDVERYSQNLK
jgi:uncharacterized protein YbbK (DUF523 family)